jgi:hypothetical protein
VHHRSTSPLARLFPLGTRVRLSADGPRALGGLRSVRGTVVGYAANGDSVRVRWDDHRTVDTLMPAMLALAA